MIRVLVWNEFRHEKSSERVKAVYPNGIHNAIADFLRCDDIAVDTATLDDENCGITKERLDNTDVLIWWGHMAHDKVPDEVANLVRDAVLSGMGMILLKSTEPIPRSSYWMASSIARICAGSPCSVSTFVT